MSTALRPYQQDAVTAIEQGWAQARRQLFVLPTGAGKTICFIRVAEHERERGGRTLILAHREELLDQARERIADWTTLDVAVEKAEQRADGLFGQRADVVVASVQSMVRRLGRYAKDSFGLVVVDESHHAPADSYQAIINHFDAKLLGCTATPTRLDRKSLKDTFDAVPYVYELSQAIEDGYLVPIRQKIVQIRTMDLGMVRTTAGDLNAGDLEVAMAKPEILHGIVRATVESAGERQALVFAPTVGYAHALAEAFGRWTDGRKALALSGDDEPERRHDGVARFRDGNLQFLINVGLFTEGFDHPPTSLIAMARPTKSQGLYTQQLGRGSRIFCPHGCPTYCQHADAKRDLLVLDFVGNAERHTLINVVDILGGGTDEEVKARAWRKLEKGETDDVLEALRRARQELAEFYRKQALAAALKASQAHIEYKEVDPFRRVYCLPWNARVRTRAGVRRIGDIVRNREPVDVLSFDGQHTVWAQVTNWGKRPNPDGLWRLRWGHGGVNANLISSPNHPVLTRRGWVQAVAIVVGRDEVAVAAPTLSTDQESVVFGTLLGDASLNRRPRGWPRLCVGHADAQLDYLLWMADALGSLKGVVEPKKIPPKRPVIRGREIRTGPQHSYRSPALPTFWQVYEVAYAGGRKRVTRAWLDRIGPLGLAVWAMDDGSMCVYRVAGGRYIYRRFVFCTDGFSVSECELIQTWLREVFGLASRLWRCKGRPRVLLTTDATLRLRDIVAPYMVLGDSAKAWIAGSVEQGVSDGVTYVDVVASEPMKPNGHEGYVYDVTVPDTHNFVLTSGLVVHNSILKIRPAAGRMGGVEPTEEQIALLNEHKVHLDMPNIRALDRGQAAEILAKIRERPRLGLGTYKMARQLLKYGFDPDVPYEQAAAIMGLIRQHNWQRPPEAVLARVLVGEKKEQPPLPNA